MDKYEQISGDRVIWGYKVFHISRYNEDEAMKKIALSKLSDEEIRVLGLWGG